MHRSCVVLVWINFEETGVLDKVFWSAQFITLCGFSLEFLTWHSQIYQYFFNPMIIALLTVGVYRLILNATLVPKVFWTLIGCATSIWLCVITILMCVFKKVIINI